MLGPLEVRRAGSAVVLGAPKLRALLLALVLEHGRAVPADRLIDGLWGDEPPPQPLVSLRSYVSNLRRLLQDPDGPPVIVTGGGGYRLQVEPDQIDAVRFEHLVIQGREALAAGDPALALEVTGRALGLWRGQAYADVAGEGEARPAVTKLEELRLTAIEDRCDALLELGRHVEALPELDAHTAQHPLRERPHRQLMLALYRSGRAPEALEVAAGHRSALVDEHGLDPTPHLGRLVDAILRQDPALDPPPPSSPAAAGTSSSGAAVVGPAGGAPDVGPARGAPVDRVTATIVGRDVERGRLADAVDRLVDGTGGIVVVSGEPGIGKTALLHELALLAEAAHLPVAWGRCLDQEGSPPFWPWIEVLRTMAGRLEAATLREALVGAAAPVTQLVPELADRAGVARAVVEGDPESARFLLFDAVTTFLARCADAHGLVIALDDLHWADRSSLELIGFLAPRAEASRLLLAGSHRDAASDRTEELDRALAAIVRAPSATSIEPRLLHRDEVTSVVARVAGRPLADELADDIHRRANGNPFFVRQLAALLADPASADPAPIPSGVRHVILRRLQQLSAEVRATLDLAAVLGQSFDVRTLAAAADADVLTVLDHVDVAIQHGVVEVGEAHASAYRFVHALVRETLEGELAPGRAARLHAAAAAPLEQLDPPPAEAVAEHLWQAADLAPTDRVVHYLRAAADEATEVFAYELAEHHLRRALDRLTHAPLADPSTELAVRLRLVQVITGLHGWTTAAREEVSGRVRELAGRAEAPAELVPLWWSLWSTTMTRGDVAAAGELATELLVQAERSGDPASLLAGHVAIAYSELFAGAEVGEVMRRLQLARTAEADADEASLARTPEHLGVSRRVAVTITHAIAGRTQDTLTAGEELVAYARARGSTFQEAYARMFAAWGAGAVDQPAAALAHGQVGLAACEGARLASVARLLTPVHGWAAARSGADPREQAVRVADAIEALETAGQGHAVGNWLVFLAEIHVLAGDADAARAALTRAATLAERTGEAVYGRQVARVRAALTP